MNGIKTLKEVQVPVTNKVKTKHAAYVITNKAADETLKYPSSETYREMLSFLENIKILSVKMKSYKVPVSIWLHALRMQPIISVFDSAVRPKLVRHVVLDSTLLDTVRNREMPETRPFSYKTLTVSELSLFTFE